MLFQLMQSRINQVAAASEVLELASSPSSVSAAMVPPTEACCRSERNVGIIIGGLYFF